MIKIFGILSIAMLCSACGAEPEETLTFLGGVKISYDGAPDLSEDTVFQLQKQVSDAVKICQKRKSDTSRTVLIDCLRVELGEGFTVSAQNE